MLYKINILGEKLWTTRSKTKTLKKLKAISRKAKSKMQATKTITTTKTALMIMKASSSRDTNKFFKKPFLLRKGFLFIPLVIF